MRRGGCHRCKNFSAAQLFVLAGMCSRRPHCGYVASHLIITSHRRQDHYTHRQTRFTWSRPRCPSTRSRWKLTINININIFAPHYVVLAAAYASPRPQTTPGRTLPTKGYNREPVDVTHFLAAHWTCWPQLWTWPIKPADEVVALLILRALSCSDF